MALPRRRERFRRWYRDTVVDSGRAATSARNRIASLESAAEGGLVTESDDRIERSDVIDDSMGDGGRVILWMFS